MGLTIVAYVTFIGWPAVRLLRSGPAPRGVVEGNRGAVYRGLVISQVALGMTLITIAGLLGRSLRSVEDQDTGFGIENVLVGNVALPMPNRPDARRVIAAERALFEAVRSAPGVLAVASAYDHPLEANWSEAPTIVGDSLAPEKRQAAELRIVSPGYFETLGVAVREGRSFSERDDLDAPGAVIVNQLFARQLDGRVIGRRIRTATPRFLYGTSVPDEYQVVGVVDNERFRGLEFPAQPAFYLSTRQFPQAAFSLLVKSSAEPMSLQDEVRTAIHATDRGITFSRQTSLDAILGQQLAERRVTTTVIGGFAGAALALAALGLYGLLTIFVASRTREMGVRVALGASPTTVALGVLQQSVRNTGIGIGLGALLSLAAGRLVGGLLVDVSPNDPITLAAVAATFLTVSLAAAWIPAVRAARTDPVEALRA
jgi:predicted permease